MPNHINECAEYPALVAAREAFQTEFNANGWTAEAVALAAVVRDKHRVCAVEMGVPEEFLQPVQ